VPCILTSSEVAADELTLGELNPRKEPCRWLRSVASSRAQLAIHVLNNLAQLLIFREPKGSRVSKLVISVKDLWPGIFHLFVCSPKINFNGEIQFQLFLHHLSIFR
jgi:hypothetical protein